MAPSFRKVATEPVVRPEIQNQVRAIMQEVKMKVPVSSRSSSSSTSSYPSIFSRSENDSGYEAKTIEENKLKEEIDQTIAADESDKVTEQLEKQLTNNIENLDDSKNTLQVMRVRAAADLPLTSCGIATCKHDDVEVNKVHAFINKYGKGKDHRGTPECVVEHLQTMTAEEYRDIQNLDEAAMDKIINDYIAAHPEDVPWIDSIKAAAVAEFNRQCDAAVTLPPKGTPAAEQAAATEEFSHTRQKDFKPRIKEGMVGVEPHALEQCSDSNCPFSGGYQDHAVVEKRGKNRCDSDVNKIHRLINKHGKGKKHDHTPKPKIEEGLHTIPKHGLGAPIDFDEAERQADAVEALHHSSPKEFEALDGDGIHHEGMPCVEEHVLEQCFEPHCPLSDCYVGDDCDPRVEKRSSINAKSWLTGGHCIIHKGDFHTHIPAEKEGLPYLRKGGKAEPIPLDEAAQQAAADQALTTTSKDVFKPGPDEVEWIKGVGEYKRGRKLPSDAVQKRGCTSWTSLDGGAASIDKGGEHHGEYVCFVKDNKHKTNPDGSLAEKGVEIPSETAKRGHHGKYRGEDIFIVKDNNHKTNPDGSPVEEGMIGIHKNGHAEPIPLTEAKQQAAADEALGRSNLKQLKKEAKLHKHVEGHEWTKGVETPSDGAGVEQITEGNEAVSEPVPLDEAAKQAEADYNLANSNLKQLKKEAKQNKHVEGNEWTKGIETPSESSIPKRNAQYAYLPTLNSRPIFFLENDGLRGTAYRRGSKTGLLQNGVSKGTYISNADADVYASDATAATAALNMDHIKGLHNRFGSTGDSNNEFGTKNTKQSKRGIFTMKHVEAKGKGKEHNQPLKKAAPEVVREQPPLTITWKDIFRFRPGEDEWIKRFKKDPYGGKMLDVPNKYQKRAALDLEDYRAEGEDGLDIQFHPLHRLPHEPVQHGIVKRGAYNAAADTYRPVNGMSAPLDKFERRVGVMEEDDAKARGYANSRHLTGAAARKERQDAAESVKEIAKNLEQERVAEQAAVEEKADKMINNVADKTGTSKSKVAQVVDSMGPGGKISKPVVGGSMAEYQDHDTFDPLKAHVAEDKKAAAKKLAKERMAEIEKEAAKSDKQYDVHGADMVDHPELSHHKHKGGKHSHHDGDHKHHGDHDHDGDNHKGGHHAKHTMLQPTPMPASTGTAWPLYKPGENVVTLAQIQDAIRGPAATVGSNVRGEEMGNIAMFLIIGAWIAILFLIMKIARRGREQRAQGGWWATRRGGRRSSGDLERLERAEKGGYLG